MTRPHVRYALLLVAACGLTALATRAVVLDAVRADYGQAGDLYRCKDALDAFLRDRPLADGERVGGDALPAGLREAGVAEVYRTGRRMHFVLPPTEVGADAATPEIVHNLDRAGGVTDEVVRTSGRYTYHIQPYAAAPHRYYWVHN